MLVGAAADPTEYIIPFDPTANSVRGGSYVDPCTMFGFAGEEEEEMERRADGEEGKNGEEKKEDEAAEDRDAFNHRITQAVGEFWRRQVGPG